MTAFVESFATQQLLPPWKSVDARTWGFAIPLVERRVKEHLDYYFNSGHPERAPYQYAPIPGPQYALLTVSDCPRMTGYNNKNRKNNDSDPGGWDHFKHREIFLAFPVHRWRVTKDNLILSPQEVVWIQPFACSTSATVVFSAREIWGADMTVADIQIDGSDHDVHIDATYMGPKIFSPRAVSSNLGFLHIETRGPRPAPDVIDLLRAKPELGSFMTLLGYGLRRDGGSFEVNHLKQFRDVHNMDRALYRAIVATRSIYPEREPRVLLDESKVEIAFMESAGMEEFLDNILARPARWGAPQMHAKPPQSSSRAPDPGRELDPEISFQLREKKRKEPDWDLARVEVRPDMAFVFHSDIEFGVPETLYTYRASYRASR